MRSRLVEARMLPPASSAAMNRRFIPGASVCVFDQAPTSGLYAASTALTTTLVEPERVLVPDRTTRLVWTSVKNLPEVGEISEPETARSAMRWKSLLLLL